ncbi:unnamed protein product [Fusarium graminearum]|nr:unnamed protein product [Fusarium graminearum]
MSKTAFTIFHMQLLNLVSTTAVCCPARVSIMTGQLAHIPNITDMIPPYGEHSTKFASYMYISIVLSNWKMINSALIFGKGGYPKFMSQGLNDDYLPVWLRDNGYYTYYTGKLFNAHTTENYDKPHAAGWTSSDFLLDPFTYSYWNATWQKDFETLSQRGQTLSGSLCVPTDISLQPKHLRILWFIRLLIGVQ